jgi:hypothetical protein
MASRSPGDREAIEKPHQNKSVVGTWKNYDTSDNFMSKTEKKHTIYTIIVEY